MKQITLGPTSKCVEDEKVTGSTEVGFMKWKSRLTIPVAFCSALTGVHEQRAYIVSLEFSKALNTAFSDEVQAEKDEGVELDCLQKLIPASTVPWFQNSSRLYSSSLIQVVIFAFQQACSECIQGSWMSCLRYHSGVISLWEENSALDEKDDKALNENESGWLIGRAVFSFQVCYPLPWARVVFAREHPPANSLRSQHSTKLLVAVCFLMKTYRLHPAWELGQSCLPLGHAVLQVSSEELFAWLRGGWGSSCTQQRIKGTSAPTHNMGCSSWEAACSRHLPPGPNFTHNP